MLSFSDPNQLVLKMKYLQTARKGINNKSHCCSGFYVFVNSIGLDTNLL